MLLVWYYICRNWFRTFVDSVYYYSVSFICVCTFAEFAEMDFSGSDQSLDGGNLTASDSTDLDLNVSGQSRPRNPSTDLDANNSSQSRPGNSASFESDSSRFDSADVDQLWGKISESEQGVVRSKMKWEEPTRSDAIGYQMMTHPMVGRNLQRR